MIPRISAQAIEVILTGPIAIAIPPIPEIKITDTTKRFLLASRLTF